MTKKRSIKIRATGNPIAGRGEKINHEKVVIPGESYTIRELMEKAVQGNLPNIQRHGSYDENPDFESIDPTRDPAFDLSDATEQLLSSEEKLAEEKQRLEQVKAEKEAAKAAKKPVAKSEGGEKNEPESGSEAASDPGTRKSSPE